MAVPVPFDSLMAPILTIGPYQPPFIPPLRDPIAFGNALIPRIMSVLYTQLANTLNQEPGRVFLWNLIHMDGGMNKYASDLLLIAHDMVCLELFDGRTDSSEVAIASSAEQAIKAMAGRITLWFEHDLKPYWTEHLFLTAYPITGKYYEFLDRVEMMYRSFGLSSSLYQDGLQNRDRRYPPRQLNTPVRRDMSRMVFDALLTNTPNRQASPQQTPHMSAQPQQFHYPQGGHGMPPGYVPQQPMGYGPPPGYGGPPPGYGPAPAGYDPRMAPHAAHQVPFYPGHGPQPGMGYPQPSVGVTGGFPPGYGPPPPVNYPQPGYNPGFAAPPSPGFQFAPVHQVTPATPFQDALVQQNRGEAARFIQRDEKYRAQAADRRSQEEQRQQDLQATQAAQQAAQRPVQPQRANDDYAEYEASAATSGSVGGMASMARRTMGQFTPNPQENVIDVDAGVVEPTVAAEPLVKNPPLLTLYPGVTEMDRKAHSLVYHTLENPAIKERSDGFAQAAEDLAGAQVKKGEENDQTLVHPSVVTDLNLDSLQVAARLKYVANRKKTGNPFVYRVFGIAANPNYGSPILKDVLARVGTSQSLSKLAEKLKAVFVDILETRRALSADDSDMVSYLGNINRDMTTRVNDILAYNLQTTLRIDNFADDTPSVGDAIERRYGVKVRSMYEVLTTTMQTAWLESLRLNISDSFSGHYEEGEGMTVATNPENISFTFTDLSMIELGYKLDIGVAMIDPVQQKTLHQIASSLLRHKEQMAFVTDKDFLVTSEGQRLRLHRSMRTDDVYLVQRAD